MLTVCRLLFGEYLRMEGDLRKRKAWTIPIVASCRIASVFFFFNLELVYQYKIGIRCLHGIEVVGIHGKC